ncbi:MAG: hypothetical protein H7122_06945 [Chitinophagaceae bacterium]|nr:hypothetical protein [Chitinophagaceae bacterium]
MKKINIIGVLLAALVLASCGTSQKFHASVSEDKPLFAAINELNKRPSNAKAQKDLQHFYKASVDRHENAIAAYRKSNDEKRWDKIINELNALQNMYSGIAATPGASSQVQPKNYFQELQTVKEEAAADFYSEGNTYVEKEGRENNLRAYQAFKKADKYVNGYRDVETLIKESYEKSVVNVVINPIEDNDIFFSGANGWGNDFNYRSEDYQQSLARDLGGKNGNKNAVRFFTDRDAYRERIDADWVVDVKWRGIDPMRSTPHQYNRQASKNVQIGSDTSGKPVYKTVYATVYVTQRSYTVRGDLDYRIADVQTKNNIDYGVIRDDVSWTESRATYSGDSRALGQEDWYLINNRNDFNNPSRGDILNSLMRKMYPDLRRRIQQATD